MILCGPFFYVIWEGTTEDKRDTGTPYAFTVILSVISAAFITAGFNSFLQRRVALRERGEEEKIQAQKEEKMVQKKVKKKAKQKNG